jgi:hypothetical protein
MKKIKKLLSIIIVVILPFQGFNAIAMEEQKREEIESNSTNGIRVRPHNRNLSAPSTISEEDKNGAAKKGQIWPRVMFGLGVLVAITEILWKISQIILLHKK